MHAAHLTVLAFICLFVGHENSYLQGHFVLTIEITPIVIKPPAYHVAISSHIDSQLCNRRPLLRVGNAATSGLKCLFKRIVVIALA